MSFTDPQSVTINAVAVSLPRTSSIPNGSIYRSNDGLVSLTATHTYGKRARHLYRIDHAKIAPDPLISAQNIRHTMSCYVVMDLPVTGYTVVEGKYVVDGFLNTVSGVNAALVTKILGGES